jgi:peptidyl-prolyl cis-trans isomerase B (cyclophilin B)
MNRTGSVLLLLFLQLMSPLLHAQHDQPVVIFNTTMGDFEVTLDEERAPASVENFLRLVDQGHYNGTIFHRVIKNFMIQGGGLDKSMNRVGGVDPIPNEADNGLKNLKGTIAMARTGDPHSATDQFFINTRDNPGLDHTGKTGRGWGYAVFGKVSRGMDTIMDIEASSTAARAGRNDVPLKTVEIIRAERKSGR